MIRPLIIAVDGPAASGKGTVAARLARHYALPYLDTGLLYRAVGLAVLDAAGRTAAVLTGRFLRNGPAKVMVLSDSMLLRESIERRLGFDGVMQARFPGIEVLPSLEAHGQGALLQLNFAFQIRQPLFAVQPNLMGY